MDIFVGCKFPSLKVKTRSGVSETHFDIYIYIYIYVCVCVCVCNTKLVDNVSALCRYGSCLERGSRDSTIANGVRKYWHVLFPLLSFFRIPFIRVNL
jgi:hypothetical protein